MDLITRYLIEDGQNIKGEQRIALLHVKIKENKPATYELIHTPTRQKEPHVFSISEELGLSLIGNKDPAAVYLDKTEE